MSISVTRTISKRGNADRVSRRERVYDQLYDPVYTVSSEVDHARTSLKGYASRLRTVPVFESMFSDVPHYPRCTLQLDPVDPVPVSVDRRWQGHREQRTEALQQLAGFVPKPGKKESQTTGAHRWKYFHRPLMPFGQQLSPSVIFHVQDKSLTFTKENNAEQQPTHVTVGIQTDYRESETQTDPYSPEYVVQPGTTPSELLQLAFLTWGHGLPAGLAEVEMIERLRAKRALEASLPPLDDLSRLDKRRHIMELIEAKEWAFREEKIQKLQETRLAVLKDLLRQRDEAQKDVTNVRLNQIYATRQKDSEAKLHKIHSDYMRALRKLEAKSRNIEGKLVRRDIVRDAIDAKTRSHRHPFNYKNAGNEWRSHYLDTYEGLMKLEAGFKSQEIRPKVKTIKRVIKPSVSRPEELMERYRNMVKEEIKQVAMGSLRCVTKKEQPVARPVTPRVEEPTEGDEERELADIYMQKLLRGRSILYERFKAKENHMELIEELRTVHALQSEEQELHRADKEFVLTLKKKRDEQMQKTAQDEASQARVVGAELEHLFDTLSKELIHLQEERRIHAFALLAERDRRRREAEESGRRQMEERRRREDDELFRQVVEVHQETVDLYLEDVILETLEQTSDQQAREEIHRQAREVNDIAYALEESQNNLQSEEIVSELVYGFLIPEVEKISVGQKVHQRQQRHLQVAQSKIQEAAELGGILSRSLEASQSTRPSGGASDSDDAPRGAGSSAAP